MRVLSISTPSKYVSVGIVDFFCENSTNPNLVAESSILNAKSEDAVLFIKKIFEYSGNNINSVDLITVASGPGSYSGLRGGLAAAKSFAQFMDKPIVSVSVLEAMAYDAISFDGVVLSILDAVKDEYNFAMFSIASNKISRLTCDMVLKSSKLKNFLEQFQLPICIVSSFDNIKFLSLNPNLMNIKSICSAKNVAILGCEKFLRGEISDLFSLVPKYSHEPSLKEFIK